jgi:hypothetical protein
MKPAVSHSSHYHRRASFATRFHTICKVGFMGLSSSHCVNLFNLLTEQFLFTLLKQHEVYAGEELNQTAIMIGQQ